MPSASRIGYPTFEMGEAADRGEIRLGGCVIGPESPDYQCLRCNAQLPWVAVDTEPVDEDAPRQDSLDLTTRRSDPRHGVRCHRLSH